MSDLNSCDCCSKTEPSIELFWNVAWNEHTERQLKVINEMQLKGFDAVCFDCFYKLLGVDMKKEKLIKKLLELNLDLCANSTEVNDGLIYDLLRYGFKGFENMSELELNDELLNLEGA